MDSETNIRTETSKMDSETLRYLRSMHVQATAAYMEAYRKDDVQALRFQAGYLNAIETLARNLGVAL